MCDPGSARVQVCPTIPNYSLLDTASHSRSNLLPFHLSLVRIEILDGDTKQFADYNRGRLTRRGSAKYAGRTAIGHTDNRCVSPTNCKIYLFKYQNIAGWYKRTEIHINANQCQRREINVPTLGGGWPCTSTLSKSLLGKIRPI